MGCRPVQGRLGPRRSRRPAQGTRSIPGTKLQATPPNQARGVSHGHAARRRPARNAGMAGCDRRGHRPRRSGPRAFPDRAVDRQVAPSRRLRAVLGQYRVHQHHSRRPPAEDAGRSDDRGEDPQLRAVERHGDGGARQQAHQCRRSHRELCVGGDVVRRRVQPLLASGLGESRRRPRADPGPLLSGHLRPHVHARPLHRRTDGQFPAGGRRQGNLLLPSSLADAGRLAVPDRVDGPRTADGDLSGAVHEIPPGPRARSHRRAQGVVLLRRRRNGRTRIDGRDRIGGPRDARQPHFRGQLQSPAARRSRPRQRQDHPGAGKRLPRRRLERDQGDLGHALGRALRPRQEGHPPAPHDGVRRRRVPDLQVEGRRIRARILLQHPGAEGAGCGLDRRGHLASQPRRPGPVQGLRRLPCSGQSQGPAHRHPREDHQGLRHGRSRGSAEHHASAEEDVARIVPDESRTFGMEGMFRQLGIWNQLGQLYTPQDADQLMFYKESKDGQILQEGINEAGAMCDWMAAATAYSTHGVQMIPFYVFYSMFGFQRVGDLAWAAGDMRSRGFLLGATAGRTTLNGEGLQHEDGQSQVYASTIPNCISYDPTFSYEVAVIIQDGLRRMYAEQQDVYYYLTVMNENYRHPAMPEGAAPAIIKGMYLFAAGATKTKAPRVQLLGSGTIFREVIAAADLLRSDWGVESDLWSCPSFTELARDGRDAERRNLLNPTAKPRTAHVADCLAATTGPIVAATDYVRTFAEQIRPWVPRRYCVLGTDGFGRSDTREKLRSFFEVDRFYVTVAALKALADDGALPASKAAEAVKKYGLDPSKPAPWTV